MTFFSPCWLARGPLETAYCYDEGRPMQEKQRAFPLGAKRKLAKQVGKYSLFRLVGLTSARRRDDDILGVS